MREVSSERYKNFYPGSTSGIYQHRQGAADFLSDLPRISDPRGIASGDSLRVAALSPSRMRRNQDSQGN